MSVATLLASGLRLFSPLELCKTMEVTVPAGGYTAGQIVLHPGGGIVGISYGTYDEGDTGILIVVADDIEVTCVAANGSTFAVGEKVYFDEADAEVNQTADGNWYCGVVLVQPANLAEKVRIMFNGLLSGSTGSFAMNSGTQTIPGAKTFSTSVTTPDLNAGSSGSPGTLDIFPTTASKGKTSFSAADNAGDTTTSIVTAAQAAARTYTVPDAGAAASFVMTEGAQTINGAKTFGSEHPTALGVGAKNGATVTAVETIPVVHKTVLTCVDTPIDIGDEAGQGQFGGVKVYDFPAGLIGILGCRIDGTMTLSAPGIDAWDGDIGLGVEAPTDHQDVAGKTGSVMPTVSTGTGSSKVATCDAVSVAAAKTESGARWLDGTGTAIDLYLNLLIDDEGAHDDTIVATFNGTIEFHWINFGDNA